MAACAAFAAGVVLVATPFAVPAAPAGFAGQPVTGEVLREAAAPARLAQGTADRYVDDDPGCGGSAPCYASVQAAVDAATGGELIRVAAGRYTETVTVVDKGLRIVGPGRGDPAQPDDRGAHALWVARSPAPGAALTFVASTADITGVQVSGFRFISGTQGVVLAANGRVVSPPTPATVISDTVVSGNLYRRVGSGASNEGALVARWTEALRFEQNIVDSGGGVLLQGGSDLEVGANRFTATAGSAVVVDAHGENVTVWGNHIGAAAIHGIVIRPWSRGGPVSLGRNVELRDNVILEAATEGIVVDTSTGGVLRDVVITGGQVTDAGRAASGGATVRGGIALWGDENTLIDVSIENVRIEGTGAGGSGTHAGVHAEDIAGTLVVSGVHVVGNGGPGVRLLDVADVVVASSTITGSEHHGVHVIETRAVERVAGIRIGGSVDDGNVLAPNGGHALFLENATGSTVSTGDVDATYNDWNTAYQSTIEDQVHHRPDDILLGQVTFMPALRTPAEASASAEPQSLVADGSSESAITLSAVDLADQPVADDALAHLETVGGTLLGGGGMIEAEADDVATSGDWVSSVSTAFGPYSGQGYLHTATSGDSLAWTFDAPSVLVRYGQTTLNTGVISATIDGAHVGTFNTVGTDKTWVDRLLGHHLGPGTHSISLTLVSGEANIDRLVAGSTSANGTATTRLRAGNTVGFGRISGRVHGATGPVTANVDVAFTAGQPADLTLDVGDESIAVGGITTTVTVTALDAQGRPVADGTPVDLSTSLGHLDPLNTTLVGGKAFATLTSELIVGTATLRAESGAAFVERDVDIVPGSPHTIIMDAEPPSIPANSHARSEVAIIVRDAWDNTVADGTTIDVTTTLGTVDPTNPTTLDGFAKTHLTAGDQVGVAWVQASAGGASGSVTVTVRATDLRITKRSAPASSVVPGESVTFTLSYANVGNSDVYGVIIDDVLPQGLISPVVRTPPRQQITRLGDRPMGFRIDRMVRGQQGDIVVAFKVDTSPAWGTRHVITNTVSIAGTGAAELTPNDNVATVPIVVVPGAVYNVDLRVPDQLAVGGDTGNVRVTLSDRYGNPAADGTPVSFSTDLGSILPADGTTRGGVATALFATDTRAGLATVAVTTLDERGAAATIHVAPGPAQQLELARAHESILVGGASTVLTATLHDQYANVVPGDEVRFETSGGLLTIAQGVTDGAGQITTTLRSPVQVGTANVTAASGALADAKLVTFLPAAPAGISLMLDRARIRVGEISLAIATVVDAFGNHVPNRAVTFESAVADARPGSAITNDTGEAITNMHGARQGVGVVRASIAELRDEQTLDVLSGPAYLPATYR